MRPMEMERYLVFRMPEVPDGGSDQAWYLIWDGSAESVNEAIDLAMNNAPLGEFEYRAVAWDDIRAETVTVERVVSRSLIGAA